MIRVKRRVSWYLVILALCSTLDAQPPDRTLAVPSDNVPEEWLTAAERTEFVDGYSYEETVAYSRRLASASAWVEYTPFGTSPQGRALPLLIVSKDGTFTADNAAEKGKLVVMIQNGIHAGEGAGRDASLMLVRDIAITKERSDLMDNLVLLVIPSFNVDGHARYGPHTRINQHGPEETGWRTTAQNLNLNRDYVKADAPEMRALLALWNEWRPHFHFDNHVTDGGEWRYDVLFDTDMHASAADPLRTWVTDLLHPHLFERLRADGHEPMRYFGLMDWQDVAKGIRSGGFGPRFSTGYFAMRNRPSILVEMHARKPFRTRVLGNYRLMVHTLALLNDKPDALRNAVRAADAAAVALGKENKHRNELALTVRLTDEPTPITFRGVAYRHELSPISGGMRLVYDTSQPLDIDTVWFKTTEPEVTVTPPVAYIIPPEWTEVIDLVSVHGLVAQRLEQEATLEVESYRFSDVSFSARSYEGRLLPRFEVEPIRETRLFPAGSVIVPVGQRDARLIVHLFEPSAPDSLVRWGFFNTIFERKEYAAGYVLEEMAPKMLAADPALKAAFEEQVRTDREFASNPRARLEFFYRHSPYWDEKLNVYPVGRLTRPPAGSSEPIRSR